MYCQLLGHKGVAFGSIGFWKVWLKHLKNYVTMQCNVLVLNTSRSRQQNAPEEPQWDCGRYMGPPMVHLDSLTGSQLFWSECQPGCVQARREQAWDHRAPNGSRICVIPFETGMNSQLALCGDVLISSAMIMKRQKAVQGSNKVQSVQMVCVCIHNVCRLRKTLKRTGNRKAVEVEQVCSI